MPALTDLSRYRWIASYRRFSTRRQAKGASGSRQKDAAAEWAERHGIELSSLSVVDAGLSGFSGANLQAGALGRLIEAVEAGAVEVPGLLLLEAQDRFGRRPPFEAIQTVLGRCVSNGLDLLLIDRDLWVTRETVNSDASTLIRLALEIDASYRFSERLSRRMLNAHEQGRKKIAAGEIARPGWAPTWIDLVDGAWQFNDYTNTVRRLLELAHHHGYIYTARLLNKEGHKSPTGKPFTQGTVQSIIRAPAVAGGRPTRRRDDASVSWCYWPALIERAEWEALLQRIKDRDGNPAHGGAQSSVNWIGQGCSVCAACGRSVGFRSSSHQPRGGGPRQTIEYVRCRGRVDGDCQAPALRLDACTAHLLTRLGRGDLSRLFPAEKPNELQALQEAVTSCQAQLSQHRAMAAALEREIEALPPTDAGAAVVLARQVAAAEQRAEAAAVALRAAQLALADHLATDRQQLTMQAQQKIRDLQHRFADGEDDAEDRGTINRMLRDLGLKVIVDATEERIGLLIGDGPTQWESLSSKLSHAALLMGGTGLNTSDGGRRAEFVVPSEAAAALLLDPSGPAADAIAAAIQEQQQD
jgi:hypothetical protein